MKKINQRKMFKHVLFLFQVLCVLIVVTRAQKPEPKSQDPCDGLEPKDCGVDLLMHNAVFPLFQGKCCYNETKVCHYEDNLSYDRILTAGLKCNTLLEMCSALKPANLDDKGACIYQIVEAPYSCCFIKYRYQAMCLPINLKDKKIFKETKYKLRTHFGWEDGGDIDIICGRGTFNKVGKMFLMLAVLFLF